MATFELNSDSLNRSPRSGGNPFGGDRFEKERADRIIPTPEAKTDTEVLAAAAFGAPDPKRLRQESIIALKVYDSCRQQDCLDGDDLGPARSAMHQCLHDKTYHEGEVIDPPDNAASVTVDRLRIKKIIIVDKRANPFKRGFWDIDLKYVFEYRIIFREADGEEIGCLKANSIFNKKITLFGSVGSDIVISTDLLSERHDESPTLSYDPFVLVEAKAAAIKSLHSRGPSHPHNLKKPCGISPFLPLPATALSDNNPCLFFYPKGFKIGLLHRYPHSLKKLCNIRPFPLFKPF